MAETAPTFHYSLRIEVRYGDLDPQGHVNNAKYLTYMEQARIGYIRQLGLWPGGSFLNLGVILADAQITFRSPIHFGDPVRVWVRIARLGNKSFDMEYQVDHPDSGAVYATGKSVQVTYDYPTGQTTPIPPEWREKMNEFMR